MKRNRRKNRGAPRIRKTPDVKPTAPSITWRETFQPKTTPPVQYPVWASTLDLGPVVEFRHVFVGDQIAAAQAYPPDTGNTVSDKVERVMDEAVGPFRFGIMTGPSGKRLVVQLSLAADISAFSALATGGEE